MSPHHEYAFMHLEGRHISIRGKDSKREKQEQEEGRCLLDDWSVQAVETAVKPDALKRQESTTAESWIVHTLDKQVQS